MHGEASSIYLAKHLLGKHDSLSHHTMYGVLRNQIYVTTSWTSRGLGTLELSNIRVKDCLQFNEGNSNRARDTHETAPEAVWTRLEEWEMGFDGAAILVQPSPSITHI